MTVKELITALDKCPPDAEVQLQIAESDGDDIFSPIKVVWDEYGMQVVSIKIEEI